MLQRAGAGRDPEGRVRPCAVPVPDQGALQRSGGGAVLDDRVHRLPDQGLHLRRRHPRQRPLGHPSGGARGGDEPGHAPPGHPAAPRQVDQAVREPEVRGHRRDSRLSRRVRLEPGQRHPPSQAHLRLLRLRPGVHLLQRHHPQPEGAGRKHDWQANGAGGRKRRAGGGAQRNLLQSPGGERPAGHPCGLHPGDAEHRRIPAEGRRAVHRVCALPADGGGAGALPQGHGARPAGQCRTGARLSRRLSAHPAPGDRTRAARGQCDDRGLHQRAGAGHRHRTIGRLRALRLSGNHRQHLAAGRARGSSRQREPADRGGQLGSAGSVHHPAPGVLLRAVAGVRADQPGQPLHPAEPRQVRRLRVALRGGRDVRGA